MNSFGAKSEITINSKTYTYYRLGALEEKGLSISHLPYSLKILLENLLRQEDGVNITKDDILALVKWSPNQKPTKEIAFTPARVLLQDFTGVPCVVDLASMRGAMLKLGGDPKKINPLQPVELVIDHSIQVDSFASKDAMKINVDCEFKRNNERYAFLKWGQKAFSNFKVVPPNTGICHQVNLEYLGRVVFNDEKNNLLYPDTLVGTDSHTTMINGLGVLGWGVGGIEAEAAMLGQPSSMLIPEVIGIRCTGKLREGVTATDLVLTVTEMLRAQGVVGKFVEFFGSGLDHMTLADRATLGNMSPEYGATCAISPVDEETLNYLRFTGRTEEHVQIIEAYMKAQGLFRTSTSHEASYSTVLTLDLRLVEPYIAGPKRPQDRIPLSKARESFESTFGMRFTQASDSSTPKQDQSVAVLERNKRKVENHKLTHGSVVIAAITSCTNTSNPSVLIAAGLLARKANQLGIKPQPWVKTSLAPGSRVVTEYLQHAKLDEDLDALGFNNVGYGCTTCIGNSGPLPKEVSDTINSDNLIVASVLSGNRNFEGRISQEVRANYLMSPPLVVAFALAGTLNIDLHKEPLGTDAQGKDVYLKDIWPTQQEIQEVMHNHVQRQMFVKNYSEVYQGDDHWNSIGIPESATYQWDSKSTYIKEAPFFENMSKEMPSHLPELENLNVLALLGDSITTDHISPAGSIKFDSPAGKYLIEHGTQQSDFNSYGSRRGHDELLTRGTFANIRIRNQMTPEKEGGYTIYLPSGEVMTIYDAAMRYKSDKTPLMVIAGKEYGSGSSRDWAAKGPLLLGVKVVLAESFERIHRSNLVGMGILPLQFINDDSISSLDLTGHEQFTIEGLPDVLNNLKESNREVTIRYQSKTKSTHAIKALVRIDTPKEVEYYRHGGILQYMIRSLLAS